MKSSLEGLWVLLVENDETFSQTDSAGRVPMVARTGNDQTFLLGFKNMPSARKFMQSTSTDAAEPRMIVKGNKSEYLRLAQAAGVSGILVDYDPSTQEYASAAELY
jgi:hypothetical protein